jgi:dTMP kinase
MFISIEGIEGAGKSTQVKLLTGRLVESGFDATATFEPGGTAIGRRIREILLDVNHAGMDAVTELLLYNAARAEHVNKVIRPALAAGKVVVTDRFTDSTMAYQGFGRGLDRRIITQLDEPVTGGLRPDLTVLLDMDVRLGLGRNLAARKVDRLELESVEFHERVRRGFLELAAAEPRRFRVVDASGTAAAVADAVAAAALEALHAA